MKLHPYLVETNTGKFCLHPTLSFSFCCTLIFGFYIIIDRTGNPLFTGNNAASNACKLSGCIQYLCAVCKKKLAYILNVNFTNWNRINSSNWLRGIFSFFFYKKKVNFLPMLNKYSFTWGYLFTALSNWEILSFTQNSEFWAKHSKFTQKTLLLLKFMKNLV